MLAQLGDISWAPASCSRSCCAASEASFDPSIAPRAAEKASDRLAGNRRRHPGDVLQHRRRPPDQSADAAEGAPEELLALLVLELQFAQLAFQLPFAFAFAFPFASPQAAQDIAEELFALLVFAEFVFGFVLGDSRSPSEFAFTPSSSPSPSVALRFQLALVFVLEVHLRVRLRAPTRFPVRVLSFVPLWPPVCWLPAHVRSSLERCAKRIATAFYSASRIFTGARMCSRTWFPQTCVTRTCYVRRHCRSTTRHVAPDTTE